MNTVRRRTDTPGTLIYPHARELIAATFNQELDNPYVVTPDIPAGMTIDDYRRWRKLAERSTAC